MNAGNRALLAVVIGLGLNVLVTEAGLALLHLMSAGELGLDSLARGHLHSPAVLFLMGLLWLLGGAAGGAMAAALTECAWLALPVGLISGLAPGLSALVGLQPLGWAVALALAPLLGALLAASAVDRLQCLDADD